MTSVKMKGANIYPRQFYKIKINENIRFTVAYYVGLWAPKLRGLYKIDGEDVFPKQRKQYC